MQKVRATLKVTDRDMAANPLTKSVARQHVFDCLLDTGRLELQDKVQYRTSRRVGELGDAELDCLLANTLHGLD